MQGIVISELLSLTLVQRSSLPYQILMYLNCWYFALFWICEALIFIYKGKICYDSIMHGSRRKVTLTPNL